MRVQRSSVMGGGQRFVVGVADWPGEDEEEDENEPASRGRKRGRIAPLKIKIGRKKKKKDSDVCGFDLRPVLIPS